jgi:hypothetical protein
MMAGQAGAHDDNVGRRASSLVVCFKDKYIPFFEFVELINIAMIGASRV